MPFTLAATMTSDPLATEIQLLYNTIFHKTRNCSARMNKLVSCSWP